MVGCLFTNEIVVGSNPSVLTMVAVTLRFELLQSVFTNYILCKLIESDIAKQNANMRDTRYPKLTFAVIRFFLITALVIIFWNFTTFWYRYDSPQLKRKLISSITVSLQEIELWQ